MASLSSMHKGRQMFIAAKNSRHRIASLSLYRALVRTALKIDIPQSLNTDAPTHPVAELVKKRFANHKNYTSFRLIYASMAAGYKFLTVLTKAQIAGSPEHTKILELVAERSLIADKSRRIKSNRTQPKPIIETPRVPVLRNIAGPGELHTYVPNPRPSGERKPGRAPMLVADAYSMPFLRFTKPQPRLLGKIISRRRFEWNKKISMLKDTESRIVGARLEDEWEALVEDQLASEKITQSSAVKRVETHQWSVLVCKLWCELVLERIWDDWVARGEAYHRIVESEHAERSRANEVSLETATEIRATGSDSLGSTKLRSGTQSGLSNLMAWDQARKKLSAGGAPVEADKNDTFISPVWAATINAQSTRLHKWMAEIK